MSRSAIKCARTVLSLILALLWYGLSAVSSIHSSWFGVSQAGAAQASLPDLIVSDVTNPPARGNAGFSFWVNNTIKNDGTANAKSSTTYYLLSLDKVIDSQDVLVGSRFVSNLKRGASYRGPTVPVTIPTDISSTPAEYYLIACADGTNSITELYENNNCQSSTETIYVLPAVDLTVIPNSIAAGGIVEVGWTEIANPSAYDWFALYTPGSSDIDYIDESILVNCTQTPTDPVPEGSCPFTIPNTLAPGTYEFRLFAGPISASTPITVAAP